jgi:hypothetical protein
MGPSPERAREALARRHLRLGWWALLCFLALGLGLEAMHGFKVGWYLNVSSQTRRLMWTLAHAHGALIALVHVLFGLTLRGRSGENERWARFAAPCLSGALVLLPGGFFLGGVYTYGGDPGLGSLLIPAGGLLLLVGVFVIARHATDA